MLRTVLVGLFACTLCACATTHEGYLVKTDTAQKSEVVFHEKYAKRGTVDAVLANGEKCEGQFNTVPDQVTRNWDDPNDIEHEDTQIGVAVLECVDHHVVRCNFSRSNDGAGSGLCHDNQGAKYALYF